MDVRMPDGTIVSGVPEGVTQTELLARYNKYTGAATAETQPSAPQGLESIAPQRPTFDPTKPLNAEDYLAAVAQRKEESPDRSVSDVAVDAGITFLKGAIGLPESFVGLADIPTKGAIGKMLEKAGYNPREANAILDTYLSEAQQAANRKVAETKGFLPTIGAALQNPSTIATGIGESLPQMLGGASIARGILAAAPKVGAVVAGGLGEGILGAGSAAEQARGENADKLLTTKQALAALGSGAGTAAFGIAGGRLAQKFGLDDIDTMLASGASRGGAKSVLDFAKRAAGSGISEGAFEEMPQSAQEKMWMNYATNKPLLEGVPEAMGVGLTTGFAMGVGGAGVGSALKRTPEDKQREKYERPAADQGLEALARSKGFLTPEKPAPAAPTAEPTLTMGQEAELRDLMEQTARAEGEAPAPAAVAEEPIPNKLDMPVAETQQPMAEAPAPVAEATAPVEEATPVEAAKPVKKDFYARVDDEVAKIDSADKLVTEFARMRDRQSPLTASAQADPIAVRDALIDRLVDKDPAKAAQIAADIDANLAQYSEQSRIPVLKLSSFASSIKKRAESKGGKASAPAVVQETPAYDTPALRLKQTDALGDTLEQLVYGEMESYGRAALKKKSLTNGYANKKDNWTKAMEAGDKAFATNDYTAFEPYAQLFPKTAKKLQSHLATTEKAAPTAAAATNLQVADKDIKGKHDVINSAEEFNDAEYGWLDPATNKLHMQYADGTPVKHYAGTKTQTGVSNLTPITNADEARAAVAAGKQFVTVGEGSVAVKEAAPEVAPVAKGKKAAKPKTNLDKVAHLRKQSWEKNPLMAYVADKGLYHEKGKPGSLMSEFNGGKTKLISGYGPVFKASGLRLDALLPIAIQDGFVAQDATEDDLYSLIQQAFSGKRIEALYKEQGQEDLATKYAERMDMEEPASEERTGQSDAEWHGMSEADYVEMMAREVADTTDDQFVELAEAVAEFSDTHASNVSMRAAMEALGFTEEEIQNEERRTAAKAPEAIASDETKGNEPSEAAPPLELETQTEAELKAKQAEVDRLTKENERLAKQAEAKAKADAEREEFVLTGSDRAADVAAAQGQKDIFGAMEEEAPAEEKFTPLKGEDGKPVVVYRGALGKEEDTFTPTNFFGTGFFGKGINLTSSPEDASKYASTDAEVNIDLPGRASVMAEALGIDYNEAKAELTKNGGKVYPLLVSLNNPLVVGKKKLTVPEPVLRLALAESNFKGNDADVDRFIRQFNKAADGLAQFEVVVNNKASTVYRQIASLQNKDGLIIEPEVAPKGKGATHYLVFDKDQVKSVFEVALPKQQPKAPVKAEKPEVASEVVGPAEKPAAPQLTREPVTIEGEFTEVGEEKQRALVTTQVKKLSDAQTSTLEKFYGFARDTEEFADAVRQDVVNFITKGATYVNGKIRAIIRSLANGVLSVAVAFNPQFVSMPYTIAVPQYETRIEQVMQEVPASVQKQMSEDAKRAYATIYPAIKAELQANDKFFIVADKQTANTFVFNPDGSPFMNSKTLFGAGIGDFVKGNNNIVSNRITPAGLFDLGLRDAKRSVDEAATAGEYDFGKVFVLDKSQKGANGFYSTTIMHSVWTKETDAKQRLAALQKPGAADSRYSFGCINVDKETYGKLVTNNLAQMDGAKIFIVPENGKDVMSFVNGEATYSTDIIRQRAEPVTKETKVEVGRAAPTAETERTVAAKEEEGPVFNSIEAETAGWSPSRIDQLIKEFGYTDGRTFGMAGYVNPADFVKATTPTLEAAEMLNEEAGELDAKAIRAQRQTPFLFWDIDKGIILDHEGRHRMAALARAGVTRAPVVLVVKDRYGNKKPDHYTPEYGTFLSGQGFQGGKGQGLSVKDLVPLSYEYKEQLSQDFGKEGFLYNIDPTTFGISPVQEEKKRSPSFKRQVAKLNRDQQKGKITIEQLANEVDWALKQSENERLSKEPAKKQRGYLEIVKRLAEATKNGDISKEAFDLATWFMRNNEALVDDLGVSIRGAGDAGVGGQYVKLSRVMRLIKNGGSNLTVVHEILHHLERMMPTKVQQAIRNAWSKQLASAQKKAKTPAEQLYFKLLMDGHYGENNFDFVDVPDGEMSKVFMKALAELDFDRPGSKSSFELAETLLKTGAVPISNYQYFNPSEFWAVNGSEMVKGRFDAVQGGTLARLKNWLKELAQKIKGLLGMNSKASIIRALDSLAKSDGMFVTEDMLGEGAYQSVHRNYRGNEAPESAWTSMDDDKLDTAIYNIVDKHIDTKRVIENIRKTSGEIAEDWDAYTKEELYHGRTAKAINDFLDNEMLPITKEMKENDVTLDELDEYLHNRHAEERNEQINRINPDPKLQDRGSGISTEDAAKYLASLPEDRAKVFEDLAAKVDAIIQKTQRILVNSGMETQETINAWNQTYEHYVPLQRDDLEYVHTSSGISGGYGTRGRTSKRATGSLKSVVDIFENIAIQRERAVMKAERARVGRALYGLAIKYPNPNFWMPINPDAIKNKGDLTKELIAMGLSPADAENLFQEPTVSDIDKKTGLVKYVINQNNRYSENVFPVRINGQDRFIIFNGSDPRAERMVRAMKNLDAEQLGVVVGTIGEVTRFLASVNTQYNPVFGAWNFLRDVQGAAFNLTTTEIAGHEKEVLAGLSPIKGMPALRAIYRDLRGKGATTPEMQKWIDLFEQYQKAGGATGYKEQFSKGRDAPGIVERELKKLDRGNARKAADAVFNWLSDYNDAMENAVRLSAFKVALDQGFSEDKAASIAKNLTVNFNRKGAASPTMQALYAFFNASVQGSARLVETLKGPAGRKIMAGGFMIGVAQAIALAMAGFDDDDPPEFLKNKNLILPTDWLGTEGGKYLIVPMPMGFNIFPGIGRLTTEYMLGQGGMITGAKGAGDKIASAASLILDSFNPLGSGSFLQMIAPTPVDPLVAIATNRDAFGRPIAKEDRATSPTPGYTRSRENASYVSKKLAEFLNYVSSPMGTKYTKGAISPTADQLDYLAGQVGGGVSRELLKTGEYLSAVAKGETSETPSYRVPVVGKMYGETETPAAVSAKFYQNVTLLAEMENEIKNRQKNREDTKEYRADHPESRLINRANYLENQITALNKQKKLLQEKGAPEDRIKKINEQKTKLMKGLNDQVKKLQQ